MNNFDKQYNDLIINVLNNGDHKGDRTGVGTQSVFGAQAKFDLREGFPLLTTKKMATKAIIHELLWFIKGETNIGYLIENGVKIWNEWTPAYQRGGHDAVISDFELDPRHPNLDLGPVYGSQWRKWTTYKPIATPFGIGFHEDMQDQLANVIERIKTNPDCRRLIVTAWNPSEIDQMGLPPCHCLFQFNVSDGHLNLQLYQRSCDLFLGVPFNIASYCLLIEMIAQVTGLKAGTFTHTYGDLHIYNNHREQVETQIGRQSFPAPKLELNKDIKNIDDFKFEDIKIVGYNSHDAIKAEIAV